MGVRVGVGVLVGVGVRVGLGVLVGDTSTVGVAVGLGAQAVIVVVHVPPALGQQNCFPPHDSTLPAHAHILSALDPSSSGGVQFLSTPSPPGHCSVQPAAKFLVSCLV